MNCQELKEAAYRYFEDLLDPKTRAEFEAHYGMCPGCAEIIEAAMTLNCEKFAQFLHDYFDDELDPEQKATFDKHIELCPPCGDYLRAYKQTVILGKKVCCDGKTLPDDVPDQLVQAILEARRREC